MNKTFRQVMCTIAIVLLLTIGVWVLRHSHSVWLMVGVVVGCIVGIVVLSVCVPPDDDC